MIKLRFFIFFLLFSVSSVVFAQTKAELEARRLEIKKEIADINKILVSTQQREKSLLEEVEEIQLRITSVEKLVRVYNQEANLITQNINENANRIDRLRTDLSNLKEDYGLMIQESYRSNNQQNRIMFLLSSESFFQAYKRLQYMKQYANYRKQQGEEIQAKTKELQALNDELFKQRKEKESILAENRKAKSELVSNQKNLKSLLAQVKVKEKDFKSEIKDKQKQVAKIDQEIERLIKEAIARENAKSGSKSTTRFKLTPGGKSFSKRFF